MCVCHVWWNLCHICREGMCLSMSTYLSQPPYCYIQISCHCHTVYDDSPCVHVLFALLGSQSLGSSHHYLHLLKLVHMLGATVEMSAPSPDWWCWPELPPTRRPSHLLGLLQSPYRATLRCLLTPLQLWQSSLSSLKPPLESNAPCQPHSPH